MASGMTDITDTTPADEEALPPLVAGLRKSRRVLWIAVGVAVVVALLVIALANGQPAATRVGNSPLVGKPAPAIEGTTVDGASASLADFKGKWVVVNFFATWCVPCRVEHPQLIRFAQSHEASGDAAVLGVVYSDNAQAVREFRDKEGGAWPMVADPKGRVALDYGVAGIPESFLISPDGVVAAKLVGGVQAVRLDEVLNQAKAGR